jgi:hypothetical protein
MTMTTKMIHGQDSAPNPWSGIDAGRREQVNSGMANTRHFRFGRRSVKRTARLAAAPRALELRGNAAYLRALRQAEMRAWQDSGGDYYRPIETNIEMAVA